MHTDTTKTFSTYTGTSSNNKNAWWYFLLFSYHTDVFTRLNKNEDEDVKSTLLSCNTEISFSIKSTKKRKRKITKAIFLKFKHNCGKSHSACTNIWKTTIIQTLTWDVFFPRTPLVIIFESEHACTSISSAPHQIKLKNINLTEMKRLNTA